jgi:hypothetical protein
VDDYIADLVSEFGGYVYSDLNSVMGSLDCAWREYRRRNPSSWLFAYNCCVRVADDFYRVVVAPYEDSKIVVNGDVY